MNVIGDLVEIQYPGYFWNATTGDLYSSKRGTDLKKLKRKRATEFTNYNECYVVTEEGHKRIITVAALNAKYGEKRETKS